MRWGGNVRFKATLSPHSPQGAGCFTHSPLLGAAPDGPHASATPYRQQPTNTMLRVTSGVTLPTGLYAVAQAGQRYVAFARSTVSVGCCRYGVVLVCGPSGPAPNKRPVGAVENRGYLVGSC